MVSELPDYLQKPTYTTRQQKQAGEMEQKVEELSAVLKAIQEQNESIMKAVAASNTIFDEIRPVVADLAMWKPHLEQSVTDLRLELGRVRQEIISIAQPRPRPQAVGSPSDSPKAKWHAIPQRRRQLSRARWPPRRCTAPGGWFWGGHHLSPASGHGYISRPLFPSYGETAPD